MKKIFYIPLLISLFIVPSVHAVTYTVCAAGAPTCDYADIGDINAVDFADGDVIQFNKGETFNDAYLTLSSVTSPTTKTITLESYGEGTLPWLGGTAHMSIYINNNNQDGLSLIIKNLRFDSQEGEGTTTADSYAKVELRDLKNINIEGCTMDGSVDWVSDQRRGINIKNSTGNIEIKDCTIQYWGGDDNLWDPSPTPTGTTRDGGGISIITKAQGTLSIHNNTITGVESDCIIFEGVDGTTTVYNNTLWNGGENSLDIKGSNNVSVYNNTMGRDTSFIGTGGSSTGSVIGPILQVLSGSLFGGASSNIDIYNNYIGPSDMVNFGVANISGSLTNSDIRIHHNYFKKAKYQFTIKSYTESLVVYDNIIDDTANGGHLIWQFFAVIPTVPPVYYNNTFYVGTDYTSPDFADGNTDSLIMIWDNNAGGCANSTFKNNIFYINDATDYIMFIDTSCSPVLDHNTWYNSNAGNDEIIDGGTDYGEDDQAAWITAGHAAELFGDPEFTTPGTVFTLDNGSNINVDTGATLNQLYDDALNSATTWSPISVVTSDQDDYGVGWERGAFVYSGAEDPPQPTMTKTTVGTIVCPYQDGLGGVVDLTFSFTTDVNAYGRISTTEQTWDVMTSAKAMTTGNGTQTLSHIIEDVACGQTISYWCSASTEVGDNGAEATTVEHAVVIGAEQAPAESYPIVLYNDTSGGATTTLYNDTSGGALTTPY